ncbi:MFS transporter, ACS family, pantothenate transporter, partial [Tremellales sp. Uapishka_1]
MAALARQMRKTKVGTVIVDVFDCITLSSSREKASEETRCHDPHLCLLVFLLQGWLGWVDTECHTYLVFQYLDQSNVTNAYVSGMKEDIGAKGNDLNYFNVAFYTAYVVGQIPLMALQTRPTLAPYFLPTLEIIWAVLTFCQSRVTKPEHLYIVRAFVGFFEAPSFGATHLILGSWYRKEEVFKRAAVFFMGNSLGSMLSGYIQAAAYKHLNGTLGLAGWRWLFVIDGAITLPIAFIGFLLFPGLPNSPKRWFFTDAEYELATTRMPKNDGKGGINFASIKRTLKRPMWWICVPAYICMIQSTYWTGYMTLWLKAAKLPNGKAKYSVELINILPTFLNLVQAFSSWLGTTLAGVISIRIMWSFPNFWILFSTIVLTVWFVPDGLKFMAFYVSGFSAMSSPILYSWINATLVNDTAERGFIISSMMTLGYCTYVWVPLFTFPTVQSPRFQHGYPASIAFTVALWAIVMFGMWFMDRKKRREADAENVNGSRPVSEDGKGDGSEDDYSDGEKTPQRGTDNVPTVGVLASATVPTL